jgi:hypothetical protein
LELAEAITPLTGLADHADAKGITFVDFELCNMVIGNSICH